MTQKTILNDTHRALGAKMVDFGGWDMPISYGSQIEEHHAVRRDAGMFDVSHMTVVDLHGARCREFLRHLLANSVDKLKASGKALYSCMLNEQGGVIDDLIVYFLAEDFFRVVVNASTRDKDLAWIEKQAAAFDVKVSERPDFAMIAVQGPHARDKVLGLLTPEARAKVAKIGKFVAAEGDGLFIARTGYTGEDGFEIIVPEKDAVSLWNRLMDAGVAPCGLGARDTLRLEMCYPLNGSDLSPDRSPIEAGLSIFVDLNKPVFIGRDVLAEQKAKGVSSRLAPLKIAGTSPPLRAHYTVFKGDSQIGELCSGTLSPSLKAGIGLAYLPTQFARIGEELEIDVRGRRFPARVEKKPFYQPATRSS